jgi:hypothetical protein
MAAMPKAFCTVKAPSSAANGLPQEESFFPSFSKYSWNDKYIFLHSPPIATIFVTDSITL